MTDQQACRPPAPIPCAGIEPPRVTFLVAEHFPSLDTVQLEDCEVIGIVDGFVAHFKQDDKTFDVTGLRLVDWLDGATETWCMTKAEAGRVGITDYDRYVRRLRDLNPALFSLMRPQRPAYE